MKVRLQSRNPDIFAHSMIILVLKSHDEPEKMEFYLSRMTREIACSISFILKKLLKSRKKYSESHKCLEGEEKSH